MPQLNEGIHTGEFILSPPNGKRHLETVTVTLSGTALVSGTVLGQVTKGGATAAAAAGNTGNGTMGSITVGDAAKPGVYKLTIVEPASNAGAFIVEDPDGIAIGNGDIASAFSAGGLSFTLADGSTDFASGDQFDITVAAGSGKYIAYDDEGDNGTNVAAGILLTEFPAGITGDRLAVIVKRDCEVKGAYLTGSDAAAVSALARLGIIVRT